MDYEYMIDFLNENTQLDFLMYSIDTIGINEGVMDILINMKNAMINFFKKVGEFFSNMIHRITNKENVSATKGQMEAKAIINKTDENCNIKSEKMPEVANKIEKVNDESMERSTAIRNTTIDRPNKQKSTHSKDKNILSKEPEKIKPEKITLNAVFLKDQYIDEILKHSSKIFSSIQSINSVVSMFNSKNYTDKIRPDFKDNFGLKYYSIEWKTTGKEFYEKPNKELYDITYTDSPRELLKIISDKLKNAKSKNNILSIDIREGTIMLNESQKIIDNLDLNKMYIGWGYNYDKDKDQWKQYTGIKKDTNSDKFVSQYRDVDKEDIEELQKFQYNYLKKSFKEQTQCYRDAIDCFKITLSEISEEINRCNQYISVIKSSM